MGASLRLVLGANGLPTQDQADIDAAFPLTQPDPDFNTAKGKERLQVY